MRQRLRWLVLAVTTLVVIALTVPLVLLVRRQAENRAQVSAERDVQSIAALVALAVANSEDGTSAASLSAAIGNLPPGRGIVLADGSTVGEVPAASRAVDQALAGSSDAEHSDIGWTVALPVQTRQGTLAVVATVTPAELSRGVGAAAVLLLMLGLGLVGAGLIVADRLGRSLVAPVGELAKAANQLASGDLRARAVVDDPPEVAEVAAALNLLAGRLDDLIRGEREAIADLSHRLRTPLTSLRLRAEALSHQGDRSRALEDVDRLEAEVDRLITEVRAGRRGVEKGDLVAVLAKRIPFWRVLAEEQDRSMEVEIGTERAMVAASESELGAMIDALVGNVFEHTSAGTGFAVSLTARGETAELAVDDAGPGFPEGDVAVRGASGGGSTGLGLDIARRLALRCGGDLVFGRGPKGGARVLVLMQKL